MALVEPWDGAGYRREDFSDEALKLFKVAL
jgi:hypothetical protein